MTELAYYGHACFLLKTGKASILFDPYLKDNPCQIISPEEVNPDYILVSHGHSDHLGDAFAIAKRTGATIVSTAEIANMASAAGCNAHAMHLGGKHEFPFGYVRLTLAFHGSGVPGGHACGFVVNINDTTVYFAGDTALFGDMSLLGKLEKLDFALLPIGDNFTMGPDDAVVAAELLQARHIVPMHYNTWPLIAQDPQKFKKAVERKCPSTVHIMQPGDSLPLRF